jgi:hypothetical protein
MIYDDLVKDFASRTFQNLQYIQEGKEKGDEVFEVTALISSLLGLIVFPKEKLSLESFKIQLCDLAKSGWPDINSKEKIQKTRTFADFFVKMRHAVAHGNIRAKSHTSNNEITELTFWNIHRRSNKKDWEINLSVAEIKQLVEKICPLIIHSST